MRWRGFYGVVDNPASVAEAVALAGKLVDGGACAVQLRLKRGSSRAFVELARALVMELGAVSVPFIVNDRLDIALVVGAAGVHLGQDDIPLAAARRAASSTGLLIGVSTHDPRQAAEAARAGADYLGFGPVFPTSTKNVERGLGAEAAWVAQAGSRLPVFPIGGIGRENANELARVGRAAASSAILGAADPGAAARALRELLGEA